MDMCEDCGFTWETVPRESVKDRVMAGAAAIAATLIDESAKSMLRPSPDRWSMIEYGSHVRDVLLTVRDRLVIGLVEDNPGFKPLYRDQRIDLGLYRADTPTAIAPELTAAAAAFGRLFDAIDPVHLIRPVQYGFPSPAERTLLWMGRQAVHETEHHGRDIGQNLHALASGSGLA